MVQLVDHPFDGGNITVLRSRVQFSFLPLFCICQISHGHVIYNLIWSRIGSTWNLVRLVGIHPESTWNLVGLGSMWIPVNLVGMVGIWWEFGGNHSQSRSNLGGFSLTWYSYQIPTIPTIPPGFHSESAWSHVDSPGHSKLLNSSIRSQEPHLLLVFRGPVFSNFNISVTTWTE